MRQEKNNQEASAARRHAHAEEVRRQVKLKEEEKIKTRKAFFEEGIKLDHEARERYMYIGCEKRRKVYKYAYVHTHTHRRKKLDEIKQRKLSELKAVGIPDKYCAEVSRRITAPPPSFTMSSLN